MKLMMKKTGILALSLLLTGIMSMTQAQPQRGNRGTCIGQVTGLSEKQENQIEEMRKAHFKEMDELRDDRRAAISWERKQEIGITMMEKRMEHLKAIRSQLNEEQKEAFNQCMNNRPGGFWHRGPKGPKDGMGRGNGRGNRGKGNGRGQGPNW